MTEQTIVIKLEYDGTIKRTRTIAKDFDALKKLTVDVFPELKDTPITFTYQDTEGDQISVCCDTDLQEAYLQLKESKKTAIKFLILKVKSKSGLQGENANDSISSMPTTNGPITGKRENPNPEETEIQGIAQKLARVELEDRKEEIRHAAQEELKRNTISDNNPTIQPIHYHVTCDGCGINPIKGNRFKCTVCPDYDLCENCEAKGIHKEHTFIKFANQEQSHAYYQQKASNPGNTIELDIPAGLFHWIQNCPFVNQFRSAFQPNNPHEEAKMGPPPPPPFMPPPSSYMPPPPMPRFMHPPMPNPHCQNQGNNGFVHWGRHWKKYAKQFMNNFGMKVKGKGRKMAIPIGGKEKAFVKITSAPEFVSFATWKLQNFSKKEWPENVFVVKKRGDIEFESFPLQNSLKPGESFELSVPIKAPKQAGKYYLAINLQTEAGQKIGKVLKVELTVISQHQPPKVEKMEETKKETEPKPEPKNEQLMNNEEEYCYKAAELEGQGYGSFEECYEALVKEKGNVEAAKNALIYQ